MNVEIFGRCSRHPGSVDRLGFRGDSVVTDNRYYNYKVGYATNTSDGLSRKWDYAVSSETPLSPRDDA